MVSNRSLKVYLFLLVGILLAGCARPPETPVDLNRLYPLASPASDVIPLRVAVAAVISPQGTVESYSGLMEYMGQRLGRPVEMVQRANYEEINQLIKNGEVDVAFVCTGAYIAGARDFGMEILLVPEINGEASYYSWLIVPQDSPAAEMADLRGKTFAFTDPLSHTGRIYPTYLVNQLGETPDNYFGRIFYTYSHDAAIEAVANGLADGAAVDNLIFLYLMERKPELEQRVRVIHRSQPFGMPPVVVSPTIRPQLKAELFDLFMGMDSDPEGVHALRILGIDRFTELDDSAYDAVREMEANAGLAGGEQP